jgi:kynurenine formamidase
LLHPKLKEADMIDFMRNGSRCFLAFFVWGAVMTSPGWGQATQEKPWWPHPLWGGDDQSGGSNWITPEKVLEAISLATTGKVYELGHVYERGMPLLMQRSYSMFIPSFPTGGPFGPDLVYNDEFLCTEIGQVGTQFDGPGHIGKRVTMEDGSTDDVWYNGVRGDDMRGPYGLLKLGVEHVKPYITRGILIDVAGYKGVETLPNGYEVTLADVRGALARQGLTETAIKPGDALLFNYGWWRLWSEPEPILTFSWPGIGREVARWIVDRQASMVGSDAATDHAGTFAVHEELILKHGIFNLEFMDFETLLADRVYEFLFVFTPLRFKGATGSPGRPLAIR